MKSQPLSRYLAGLRRAAYVRGIYAPKVEMAAYHFQRLLAADLAP